MPANGSFAGVQHIFCPTDLTPKSQRTLVFAEHLASMLGAQLTAFHSIADTWLNRSTNYFDENKLSIERQILGCFAGDDEIFDLDVIVEKGSNPVPGIIRAVRDLNADLVVMKARRGFSSALHFGSIVERVISSVRCPVLLLPTAFLAENDPAYDKLNFKRILFDYDFSQATDELFHLTNKLTRNYDAELHVLSVLEPPAVAGVDLAQLENSKSRLKNAVSDRLSTVIRHRGVSSVGGPATVEWGSHIDKIIDYSRDHEIDLICTTLPAPSYFLEKIYRLYLGQLLTSAACPILVKQCV